MAEVMNDRSISTCFSRLVGICRQSTAWVVLALIVTASCRTEVKLPKPGASEREVETLLGSPAVVESDPKEFGGDVRRLGDCLEGKRETVGKVWRYHKPEDQETIVAFDRGGRVLCAKAGGISLIH